MRKKWSLVFAFSLLCLTSIPAFADISDYVGQGRAPARCPKTVVIKPDLNSKNIFYPVSISNLQSASNMIGSAVANKFEGATVISAKDLDQYRACNVPVVLAKLKSYSTDSAIFGQHVGNITISVLHFASTNSSAPDKQGEVSASGERQWGDDAPFMNAVKAVSDEIQKTSLF